MMETQDQSTLDRSATVDVAKEVVRDFGQVVSSELNLALAEFKEGAGEVLKNSPTLLVTSVVAVMGVFPFMAFLVLGIGRLFGDNYWLSSLVVFALFSGIGGAMAYRALRRMRLTEMNFPKTRRSLRLEKDLLSRKVVEIGQRVRKKESL